MALKIALTRRVKFSAAHRYHRAEWDEAKNREVFGDNVDLHGHNYVLEATVTGEIDPVTGMAADIGIVDRVLAELATELGYKELRSELPLLEGNVPTTENLAMLAWRRLEDVAGQLARVRLYESPELYVEITDGSAA